MQCVLKLLIYETHIFELRNEEISVKKILAVINATLLLLTQLRKESLKKKPDFFRLSFRNCISCVNNCVYCK